MGDVSITVPYTTKDGKELPITFKIPRDKLKIEGGKVVGGDTEYVKKAAQMAGESRYPDAFDHKPPTDTSAKNVVDSAPVQQNRTGPWWSRMAQGAWDTLKAAPTALSLEQTAPVQMPKVNLFTHPGQFMNEVGNSGYQPPSNLSDRMTGLVDELPMVHGLRTGDVAGTVGEMIPSMVGGTVLDSPRLSAGVKGAVSSMKDTAAGMKASRVGTAVGGGIGAITGYQLAHGAGIAPTGVAGIGAGVGGAFGSELGKYAFNPSEMMKSAAQGWEAGAGNAPWGGPILRALFGDNTPGTPLPRGGTGQGAAGPINEGPLHADPVYNTATGKWETPVSRPRYESPHAAKLEQAPFRQAPYPETVHHMGGPEVPLVDPQAPQLPTAGGMRQLPPHPETPQFVGPKQLPGPIPMGPDQLQLGGGPQNSLDRGPIVTPPPEQPPTVIRGLLPAPELPNQWRGPGSIPPGNTLPEPTLQPITPPVPPAAQSVADRALEAAGLKKSAAAPAVEPKPVEKPQPIKPPIKAPQLEPKPEPKAEPVTEPEPEIDEPEPERPKWTDAAISAADGLDASYFSKINDWAVNEGLTEITPEAVARYKQGIVTESNWWQHRRGIERLSEEINKPVAEAPISNKAVEPEKQGPVPKPQDDAPKEGTLTAIHEFLQRRVTVTSNKIAEAFGIPVDLASRAMKELEGQGKVKRSGSNWSIRKSTDEVKQELKKNDPPPNASKISQIDPAAQPNEYFKDVIGRAAEGAEISHDDLYNLARIAGVQATPLARALIEKGYKVQESKFPGKYGLKARKTPEDPVVKALVDAVLSQHKTPPQ